MNKLSITLLILTTLFIPGSVFAGHESGTEGWYCEGNNIMYDMLDGNHEFVKSCGNDATCSNYDDPPYNNNAKCVPKNFDLNSSCYKTVIRNECTGCGLARQVSQDSCTGETSITAYNMKDSACNNEEWCGAPTQPTKNSATSQTGGYGNACTIEFLYNECTGCGEAKSVGLDTCSGEISVLNPNVVDGACRTSKWCGNYDSPIWNLQKYPSTDMCAETIPGDLRDLVRAYKNVANGKPLWVTEIGHGSDNQSWQAHYLARVFNLFAEENIPVVIWYGWNDSLSGGNNRSNWGLYHNQNIKSSGSKFKEFVSF